MTDREPRAVSCTRGTLSTNVGWPVADLVVEDFKLLGA